MPIDYKEYPTNWKEIRQRILLRASNRCEECGLPNHSVIFKSDRSLISLLHWDMIKAKLKSGYSNKQALRALGFTQIILTIAHLDHDKSNFDVSDDRLKALCQKCHLSYDLSRHVENRKYGRNFRKNQVKLF